MDKLLEGFRDGARARELIARLKNRSGPQLNFMEVCGTHTVAISRFGLRQALPDNIKMISGPGCPVCVTANSDLDKAIALASLPDCILTTFGDMMKVPGSYSSLAREKAEGRDIRVCYSTLDALKIAEENPGKKVVFYGVGFETTAPTIALSLFEAKRRNLKNYFVLSVHKTVPRAMAALLELGEVKLHGFLCPGHVTVIIGTNAYLPVAQKYGVPCVVAGFEPVDILQGIIMLARQVDNGEARVENQYKRLVTAEGNLEAQRILKDVFDECDADWRGIGVIPGTGYKISDRYREFDASFLLENVELPPVREPKGCSCGEILRGIKYPYECALFGKACTPENPVGPCMVSSEGSCAAYYRYEDIPRARA